MACSRLGTMLYLYRQKGKEATKTAEFQQQIGGTAACITRLIRDTKGCDQMTSNETYFTDRCFSGVKTVEESMYEGVEYCGPVKTTLKVFLLDTL